MLDVASVAKRARGENFPVASLAFPRELRPHIRALYAYARLVDILGDELEGGAEARFAALDELEREVDAAYVGAATWRSGGSTSLPRIGVASASLSSTGRARRSGSCSSSRPAGPGGCSRRASRSDAGWEAGPDAP